MKLIQELLEMQQVDETVTFDVAEFIQDDPDFPKGLFTGAKWWRKEMKKCDFCEDGKEHYRAWTDADGKHHPAKTVDCDYCHGKGEHLEHVSDSPELNVSNDNAIALLNFLGVTPGGPDGTVGHIEPKDLPALRRKLIKMKNGGADGLEKPDEIDGGQMIKTRDEHGNPMLKKTARSYEMGRTSDQVMHYIDRLLQIIDFAQKNNAYVTWA